MSLVRSFSKWFKSTKEQEEIVDLNLKTMKAGNFVEFDLLDQPEVSGSNVGVEGSFKVRTQSNQTLVYKTLQNGMMVRQLDSKNFELVQKVNPQIILDSVGDNFNDLLTIDDDEIVEENNQAKLVSKEKSFTLEKGFENWIPSGNYYSIIDEIECLVTTETFQNRECRFFRTKTLDDKHFLMLTTYEGGETDFYIGVSIPLNYIKDIM